jgi:hypothetical protein
MDNQLTVLPEEIAQIAANVSVEKRNEVQTVLNHVFNGVSKMREQLDSVSVVDQNDKVNMKLANTIRLGVRQVRLEAEKTFDAKRSEVQQQMLSYKTEDSLWLKAKQTMQILTKEIEENARWKEETKERFEAEQKELKVQQRIIKITKFNPYLNRSEFENMSDEMFDIFFSGIEKAFNDKIEAELKAEEERIAKQKAIDEENERIILENIRLQKEAEEKEKALAIERKKQADILAKQKADADAKAKIEADKHAKIQADIKAKAEAERKVFEEKAVKEKAITDAKLKAEKEAKEKLEKELKAKAEAENNAKLKAEKEEKERKEAERKAAKAPKKQKLNTWIDGFVLGAPSGLNEDKTVLEILKKFEGFKQWAKSQIENI